MKHMIRNELLCELTACADGLSSHTRIAALDDSSSQRSRSELPAARSLAKAL
jgi:hypothetical protein